MNIMMIGDICGKPGRMTVIYYLQELVKQYNIDVVIANGENAAGGVGITKDVMEELLSHGIDVITTGNHVWDKKEIFDFIDASDNLVRPANYPPGTPGHGFTILPWKDYKLGIVNLAGRVFMPQMDCPFRAADQILSEIQSVCDMIFVDFHAETTSEKMALAWYLDGRISALVGTHTHVQTADERILQQGTAFISDVGMVGPRDSVLGVDKEIVIKKFLSGLPAKFSLAKGDNIFCAVVIRIDPETGKAENIQRIQKYL